MCVTCGSGENILLSLSKYLNGMRKVLQQYHSVQSELVMFLSKVWKETLVQYHIMILEVLLMLQAVEQ